MSQAASILAESTQFIQVRCLEDLPAWTELEGLVTFLSEKMKPFDDTPADVERGLRYALDPAKPGDGFAILAGQSGRLVGAVVILATGMKGYIPENVLLFVCVDPELRGRGLGGQLIQQGLSLCQGQTKLHVESDNPAKRLYERMGFVHKYDEMRHAGEQNK